MWRTRCSLGGSTVAETMATSAPAMASVRSASRRGRPKASATRVTRALGGLPPAHLHRRPPHGPHAHDGRALLTMDGHRGPAHREPGDRVGRHGGAAAREPYGHAGQVGHRVGGGAPVGGDVDLRPGRRGRHLGALRVGREPAGDRDPRARRPGVVEPAGGRARCGVLGEQRLHRVAVVEHRTERGQAAVDAGADAAVGGRAVLRVGGVHAARAGRQDQGAVVGAERP